MRDDEMEMHNRPAMDRLAHWLDMVFLCKLPADAYKLWNQKDMKPFEEWFNANEYQLRPKFGGYKLLKGKEIIAEYKALL